MKKFIVAMVVAAVAMGVTAEPASANTYYPRGRNVKAAKVYKKAAYKPRMTKARMGYAKPKMRKAKSMGYGYGGYGYTGYAHPVAYTNSNVAWVPSVEPWQVDRGYGYGGWQAPSNANVQVMWAPRGGTCNIRYTEANEPYFKYRTSAGCDEVHHVVGSLQAGQQYRFQVAKDSWDGWSGTAVAQAW